MDQRTSVMPKCIFFYGTLRPALATGDLRAIVTQLQPLGKASLPGQLFDLGPYPAAILDGSTAGTIVGEVFVLPENSAVLDRLDQHEEYRPDDPTGSAYLRVRRTATLNADRQIEVWVYAYNRTIAGATLVPHGDYVLWRNLS